MGDIKTIGLDCGAVLVVEPIRAVKSAAVDWLLPMGVAADPESGDGQSVLLGELIFRGAGGLTAREHSDALDRIGAQRSGGAGTHHLRINAVVLGDRVGELIKLMGVMVRRPKLPVEALDAVRSLCLQSLDGLEDDPQQQVMLQLRERHLPSPFNRHRYGEREVLEGADIDELRAAWTSRCRPGGCIISAAGAVDAQALSDQLNQLLEGFEGDAVEPEVLGPAQRGQVHLSQDTSQVHIGIAYDAPAEPMATSMLERVAVAVLSGGTSARLFTEVRQRRSLCYSVGASYRPDRDRGVVTAYAGTTPERAQETLDVCLEQIQLMHQSGVNAEELDRATTGLKSHLVMQGESTSARSAAIASDCYRLGRPRTLTELVDAIDAITVDGLNDYLRQRELGPVTVASLGPVPLQVPEAVA